MPGDIGDGPGCLSIRRCRFAGTFCNGANRDRTGDLLLAKQALSQLSYGPRVSEFTRCATCGNARRRSGARLLVEVEVARRALLEPEPLLLGRVAQELGRLLEHVLGVAIGRRLARHLPFE